MQGFKANKKNLNGGFIGILVILIVVAGIALFAFRTDLFTKEKSVDIATDKSTGLEGNNMLQQGQSAINKAKDVKALVEQDSKNTTEQQ